MASRRPGPRRIDAESAPYFGAELTEHSLVPTGDGRFGEIPFEEWLNQQVLRT